jgi:glycosyltransferase domain-containing protein
LKTPILLLSLNRPQYLDRIHSYYQKRNYDHHLIIADGSKKQWLGAESFNGIYLHLPSMSFAERLNAGLEQSEADFVALCADDDFLVPSGLEACVEFLRNNPDYSCVHGQYRRFVINENKINYTQKYAAAISLDDNDPIKRTRKAFVPKYIPHVFAVHRRKNFERILACREMNDFEYIFNFEMLLTFSSIMNGKAQRLPVIYNFREMENIKIGINNNNSNIDKINRALDKCNSYLKFLAEDQIKKSNFFEIINMATDNLLKYHVANYNRSSKDNLREKKSNNLIFYLSKLKNPNSWYKLFNPQTIQHVLSNVFLSQDARLNNSFPLHDDNSVKEFEIIDKTLIEWIESMKSNNGLNDQKK